MPNSEVKETLCARCAHREVCIYKQDFIDIIKAIENAATQRSVEYILGKMKDKLEEKDIDER